MTLAAIRQTQSGAISVASSTWTDVAEIASTGLEANKTYLIIVSGWVANSSSSSQMGVRVGYGTTPTIITDSTASIDAALGTAVAQHPFGYAFVHTQGGTAERYIVQVNNSSGSTTTGYAAITAIKLSDDFTSGTDYHANDVTADYSTTASWANQASVTFTPNGTDTYLYLAWASYRPAVTDGTSDFQMRINDSVAGALTEQRRDGEDATNDIIPNLIIAIDTPSAASRTLSVQFQHSGSVASTVFNSSIFALRLNRFATFTTYTNSGQVTPATNPDWTTVATIGPTPSQNEDWFVLSQAVMNSNTNTSTRFMHTRHQINASGAGLVSNPAWGDTFPNQSSNRPPDLIPVIYQSMPSLTSGAARTINLDAQADNLSSGYYATSRYIAAFPADLASSETTYNGSFTADAYIRKTASGTFTADSYIKATFEGSFTADAYIQKTASGSFTADAYIKRTFEQSFTADANIKNTLAGSFTADAAILRTFAGSRLTPTSLRRSQAHSPLTLRLSSPAQSTGPSLRTPTSRPRWLGPSLPMLPSSVRTLVSLPQTRPSRQPPSAHSQPMRTFRQRPVGHSLPTPMSATPSSRRSLLTLRLHLAPRPTKAPSPPTLLSTPATGRTGRKRGPAMSSLVARARSPPMPTFRLRLRAPSRRMPMSSGPSRTA